MRPTLLALTAALVLTACSDSTTDTTNPVATINIPAEYSDPNQVELHVSATDNVGVTRLVIERDDKDDNVEQFVPLKTVTSAPFSLTYTDTPPASGTYTYRAVAYDAAGNRGWAQQQITLRRPEAPEALSGTLVEPGAFSYPLTTTPWSGGAGQVILETDGLKTDGGAPSEVLRGSLDAAGHFALDLKRAPGTEQRRPASVAALLGEQASGCSGDAAVSPTSANLTLTHLRVQAQKSGVAAPFTFLEPVTVGTPGGGRVQNTHLSVSRLIYADRPAEFRGSLTCPQGSGVPPLTVLLALRLDQGWNRVTVQTVSDSAGHLTNAAWSLGFPASVGERWVLLPRSVQVTP